MTVLISKGIYISGSSWGGHKINISPHLSTRILKVYIETLTGFRGIYHPESLTPHFYLKAVSLEQLLGAAKASRMHIYRGDWGEPPNAHVSSSINLWAHLLNDLPLHYPSRV